MLKTTKGGTKVPPDLCAATYQGAKIVVSDKKIADATYRHIHYDQQQISLLPCILN
jgi:hypothetical protein